MAEKAQQVLGDEDVLEFLVPGIKNWMLRNDLEFDCMYEVYHYWSPTKRFSLIINISN